MKNDRLTVVILKLIVMAFALIPILITLPAMVRLWRTEPADMYDPCYLAVALAVAAVLLWRRYKEGVSSDGYGLVLALPGAVMTVTGWIQKEPQVVGVASIFFAAGMMWILFGWRLFYRMFPVPLIALLALPTTWYYGLFPGITFHWKLTLAAALVLYAAFALVTDFNPIRRRTAFFAAGIIIYAIAYAAL